MDHQEGQANRFRRRGRAVDIEAPKLGYQMPIQYAVHGDARATAEALLAELDRRGMTSPKGGRRSDTMRERIQSGPRSRHRRSIPARGRHRDWQTVKLRWRGVASPPCPTRNGVARVSNSLTMLQVNDFLQSRFISVPSCVPIRK
jgi:hypothetical protein